MKQFFSILILTLVATATFGQTTGKFFSELPTMSTVDNSTWFVTLDGMPKVWKKFGANTLRSYVNPTVTSIANATAISTISNPYEGDLAINTNRDTLWIRATSSWIIFKAGTSGGGGGSTPSLQSVLAVGNSANSLKITNLATPTSTADAATKGYVDTQISGVSDAANTYSITVSRLTVRDSNALLKPRLLPLSPSANSTPVYNGSTWANQIYYGAECQLATAKPSPLTTKTANVVIDTTGSIDSFWVWNTSKYILFQAGGVTDGNKGVITVSNNGQTWVLNNASVASANIVIGGVTSSNILDGTIDAVDIATNAISTVKIQNSAVDSIKAGNLALSDINTSSGSIGQVPTITASGLKYRTPASSGGGSFTPAGVNNSIQANSGGTTVKADTTVKLGSRTEGSFVMSGLKLGKQFSTTAPITPSSLIFSNKYKTTSGGTSTVPLIFESATTNSNGTLTSENSHYAFVHEVSSNIANYPSIGNANRPADTTWNEIMKWGWNPAGAFHTPSVTHPAQWYAMESNWYNGGQKWLEYHLSANIGQGEWRLFTTEIQNIKSNPTNVWSFRSDGINWGALKTNVGWFAGAQFNNARTSNIGIYSNGINLRMQVDSTSNIAEFYNSYGGAHSSPKQFNFTGFDRVNLGNGYTNGVSVNNSTGYLTTLGITAKTTGNYIVADQGIIYQRNTGGWPIGHRYRDTGSSTDIAYSTVSGATGAYETYLQSSGGWYYNWILGSSTVLSIANNGNVGLKGVTTGLASARLHLGAGTATASTAPLKFTSGTNLTTPEAGVVEYDGTEFYATTSSASRFIIARVLKSGSQALTFGSVSAGSNISQTYTFTLAATTDALAYNYDWSPAAGCTVSARISAANTILVTVVNASSISVTVPTINFTFTVIK